MVSFRVFPAVALVTLVVAAPGAASTALARPDRAFSTDAKVLALALAGRSVVAAVDETRTRCPRVELWQASSNARHRFRSTIPDCKWGPSTGVGLTSVAVAGTRVFWITYGGGNTREWSLWMGTTSSPPKRLRLVRRAADSREPPLVLGPGTVRGVPYAVGNEVVYVGANGKRVFTTTVRAPVRALAAGPGPEGIVVAVLLAEGWVVALDEAGHEYWAEPYPPATAVRLTSSGVAVHSGVEVEITYPRTHETTIVELPPGATMLDVAQQRILYSLEGDLWATRIDTGERTRLVDGTPAKPALGQSSRYGLAWARGARVAWRSGTLP